MLNGRLYSCQRCSICLMTAPDRTICMVLWHVVAVQLSSTLVVAACSSKQLLFAWDRVVVMFNYCEKRVPLFHRAIKKRDRCLQHQQQQSKCDTRSLDVHEKAKGIITWNKWSGKLCKESQFIEWLNEWKKSNNNKTKTKPMRGIWNN